MLGENRSKAAFCADSEESIQKESTPSKNPDYPVGDAGWKPPELTAGEMEQSVEDEIPVPVTEPELPA